MLVLGLSIENLDLDAEHWFDLLISLSSYYIQYYISCLTYTDTEPQLRLSIIRSNVSLFPEKNI